MARSTSKTLFYNPFLLHNATLLPSGEVLVAGGEDSQSQILATAELYNPATGQWTATGSMTVPRTVFGMALLGNGQVLAAGGATPNYGSFSNTAELYNPSTRTWRGTANMDNS